MSYTNFRSVFGTGSNCVPLREATEQASADRLPGDLVSFWSQEGFCSYDDGLFWIVAPTSLGDILPDIVPTARELPDVIGRNAFGDLFVWGNGGVHYFDVHYKRSYHITESIREWLDDFLCQDERKDWVLREDLYRKCRKRLRAPARDECYAFVPALALGGLEEPRSVEIVKLREHLGILSQL